MDKQIYEVLVRIEKALKVPQDRTVAGGSGANRGAVASTSKSDKTFSASAKSVNIFSDALKGATSSTERFRKTIRRADFALGSFSKRVSQTNVSQGRVNLKGVNLQVGDLQNSLSDLNKSISQIASPTNLVNRLNGPSGLFKQLSTLTANVRLLNRAFGRPQQQPSGTVRATQPPPAPPPPQRGMAGFFNQMFGAPNAQTMRTANTNFGRFIGRVGAGAVAMGILVSAVKNTAETLGRIITDDMYQTLAARGYGLSDALFQLYGDALSAGMSLSEYTKMLDEDMNTVSRSKSFEAFNQRLRSTNDVLAGFGIFGQEAAQMTSSIMSASTALGVPMDNLSDSVGGQISVFEKLRKTTNITAEGFTELMKAMRDDIGIQNEMIGLRPAERAARMQEIQTTLTYGKALNLTTQQQNQVTEALKAGRRATIKQRFQQAGMIRQTGALVGMDSSEVEEQARLALTRNRTAEQDRRFLELNAKQTAGLERMMQSGDPGSENIAQIMTERRDSAGLTGLDTASVSVALAKQAGDIENANLGKKLGEASKALGNFITILEGAGKNPIGNLAMQAVGGIMGLLGSVLGGAIFATTVGNRIAAAVTAALAGRGAIPGASPQQGRPTPPSAPPPPNGGPNQKPRGRIGKLIDGAKNLAGTVFGSGQATSTAGKVLGATAKTLGVVGALATPLMSVYDMIAGKSAEQRAAEGEADGDVGKIKGQDRGELIGSTAGAAVALLGGPLALAISPLTSMLGGWLGKAVGGWIGSESAAEKNARELKKNTEALRATAASTTITADSLGMLSANVLQTAKAYADPNLNKKEENKPADANKNSDSTPLISSATAIAFKRPDGAPPTVDKSQVNAAIKPFVNQVGQTQAAAIDSIKSTIQPAAPIVSSLLATPTTTLQKGVIDRGINKPTVDETTNQTNKPAAQDLGIDPVAVTSMNDAQSQALNELVILMRTQNEFSARQADATDRLLRLLNNSSMPGIESLFSKSIQY